MAEYSPMMQHYLKTHEEYKDCILFYRLGDFYEMFFDDALIASRELELTDSYWKRMWTRRKSTNVWGTISCSGKLYSTLNK